MLTIASRYFRYRREERKWLDLTFLLLRRADVEEERWTTSVETKMQATILTVVTPQAVDKS